MVVVHGLGSLNSFVVDLDLNLALSKHSTKHKQ